MASTAFPRRSWRKNCSTRVRITRSLWTSCWNNKCSTKPVCIRIPLSSRNPNSRNTPTAANRTRAIRMWRSRIFCRFRSDKRMMLAPTRWTARPCLTRATIRTKHQSQTIDRPSWHRPSSSSLPNSLSHNHSNPSISTVRRTKTSLDKGPIKACNPTSNRRASPHHSAITSIYKTRPTKIRLALLHSKWRTKWKCHSSAPTIRTIHNQI